MKKEKRKKIQTKNQKYLLDTLLVSDIHLGSTVCRPLELINVLNKYRFKRLILLGDVFDDMNFEGINKYQLELILLINTLGKKKNLEFVWIEGNHDHKNVIKVFSGIFGIPVVKEYTWMVNGEKYFAIHGDQFDEYLTKYKMLNCIAVFIYSLFQKMNTRYLHPSKLLRIFFAQSWQRASEKVARGAVIYSTRKNKARFVFCGHTHQSMYEKISGVHYYNTGCFADTPYSFITISQDGKITRHEDE